MKTHQANLKLRSGNFSIERHRFQNIGINERLISMFLGGILINKGLKNPFKPKILYGIYMSYRGLTGRCPVYEQLGINARKPHAVNVRGEFIIDRPAKDVYSFWRNLNNLPGSLKHLTDVQMIDERLSTWKSNVLGDLIPVTWDAEIVKDEPGHLIGWRASSNSLIHHVGKVEFTDTHDGSGTILQIVLSYHPPVGGIGVGLANLLNPFFEQLLKKEINDFKHTIENQTPAFNQKRNY